MAAIGALLPWTWSRVTNCLTGLENSTSICHRKRVDSFEQSHSLLIFAFHC